MEGKGNAKKAMQDGVEDLFEGGLKMLVAPAGSQVKGEPIVMAMAKLRREHTAIKSAYLITNPRGLWEREIAR